MQLNIQNLLHSFVFVMKVLVVLAVFDKKYFILNDIYKHKVQHFFCIELVFIVRVQ